VDSGNIKSVSINVNEVKGDFVNGRDTFHTVSPRQLPKLYDLLNDKKVAMTFNDSNSSGWVSFLVQSDAIPSDYRILGLHAAPDAGRQ